MMNADTAPGRATRLDRLTAVLARLDVPSRSVSDLLSAVPVLVRELGFDRVVIHRVEAGTADTQLAGLIRDLHPVLVTGIGSYVAAPIVSGGRAVGVVQADCRPSGRRLDETDRDILAAFAAGLRMAIASCVLHEQLLGTRSRVAQLSRDLSGAPGKLEAMPAADGTARPPAGPPPPTGVPDGLPGTLTDRELQVLGLMAAGCTNGMIADRLTIAEGTAKKHVLRVLRKLDVNNRSEAVARWFLAQHAARSVPVLPGST